MATVARPAEEAGSQWNRSYAQVQRGGSLGQQSSEQALKRSTSLPSMLAPCKIPLSKTRRAAMSNCLSSAA